MQRVFAVIASSPWSPTCEGKRAITDELLRRLFRQLAGRYKARAIRPPRRTLLP